MPSRIPHPPLEEVLPPLIFGCATFNHQYNPDPFALDTEGLVHKALSLGIRAFDTSPYYGPSEELLGAALASDRSRKDFPREEYFILTKCGRIAAESFDYSPEWIRQSIKRSLQRLQTEYLDLVYCHDIEFVSDEETVTAVKELRRIRDQEGTIKYVGISGYPLDVLCRVAQRILDETGEPVDAVMSYANFTIQNTTLLTKAMPLFLAAGVKVVPNASPLGMGLLRKVGPPDWHPGGADLRDAVKRVSDFCDEHEDRIEVVATRYALERWLREGSAVGARGDPASGVPYRRETVDQVGGGKLGVSVIGVSNDAELTKAMQVWRSILDGQEDGKTIPLPAGRWKKDHQWSLGRSQTVALLAEGIEDIFGEQYNWTWASPGEGYVNQHKK
jgi:D-arabinose 1-dehydrogenase